MFIDVHIASPRVSFGLTIDKLKDINLLKNMFGEENILYKYLRYKIEEEDGINVQFQLAINRNYSSEISVNGQGLVIYINNVNLSSKMVDDLRLDDRFINLEEEKEEFFNKFINVNIRTLIIDAFRRQYEFTGYFDEDFLMSIIRHLEHKSLTKITMFEINRFLYKNKIIAMEPEEFKEKFEYLNKKSKEIAIKNETEKVEKIMQQITSENMAIDERIEHVCELEKMLKEKNRTLELLKNRDDHSGELEKFSRIAKNPLIHDINIKEDVLFIHTVPIFLNYDTNKINSLPSEVKPLIEKGLRPNIGTHIIKINLSNFGVRFEPKEGIKNYHIEDYNCYGTFESAFTDAKRNTDLPRLIALSLQILSHVTAGDSAGSTTLKKALYVDQDNYVVNYLGMEKRIHLYNEINGSSEGEIEIESESIF